MIDEKKLINYLNEEIFAANYYEAVEAEKSLSILLSKILKGEFEEDE
jgi:hypothetical protein